ERTHLPRVVAHRTRHVRGCLRARGARPACRDRMASRGGGCLPRARHALGGAGTRRLGAHRNLPPQEGTAARPRDRRRHRRRHVRMTSPSELYDPGLQPERTLLAWRRTCLSFAIASLIAARFSANHLGIVAVVVGVLGAGLAAAAYFATVVGYRRAQHALRSRS